MRKKLLLVSVLISFLFSSFSQNQQIKALISDTLDVIHYDINLEVAYINSNQISGYTELTIVSKKNNLQSFSLELLKLTVDSVKVNNSLATFVQVPGKINITLSNTFNTYDTITVRVYYHGIPQVESYGWGGFHVSSGISYNLGISFGDDPHNYGKCFFPCVDDFIDRAFYDLHITVDSNKFAVCGGILQSNINNGNGSRTFHWRMNQPIPAYLASVAVYNYVSVSDTYIDVNGRIIPVDIYVLPIDTSNARNSFINLKSILQTFEYFWGAYKWDRVGYVATTLGAMEHATNIAYPASLIDGTLDYEKLIAHELSHHWFGNLITCKTAEDMWINEGWATFCEALYKEGVYGKKEYKDYLRQKLQKVLQFCHIKDNGYRALYGIPSNYTYGETVYQKGSTVVQTLRGYLGDSLFFGTVKAMLQQYAFKDISTIEMQNFFTSHTGKDMSEFFNFYVFQPGFTHFSIDSMVYSSTNSEAKVYVRQRIKSAPALANKNVLEVTFMNNQWQKFTDTIQFSGEFGSKCFNVPFVPEIALIDLEEKIADATTDKYEIIKNSGLIDYSESFFQLNVQQISDSALVRVTHNWVNPDKIKNNIYEINRIHPDRYWNIEGIYPANFNAEGKFYYNRLSNQYLDNKFMPSHQSADSLVLLYRENSSQDWKPINFLKNGDIFSGYLTTQNLKNGEYVLAIGKPFQSNININFPNDNLISIFPNPADNICTIELNENIGAKRVIVKNIFGQIIHNHEFKEDKLKFTFNTLKLTNGTYCIEVCDEKSKIMVSKKLIISK